MNSAQQSKTRSWLINIGVLLASCIVSAILGELGVRIALPPPQIVVVEQAPDLEVRHKFEQNARAIIRLNKTAERGKRTFFIMTPTGRRLRANTHVTIRNHWQTGEQIEIETNNLGYRNPSIGPKQGRRFLFLGDSITLAAYQREENTFVRRIERIAHQDGLSWETVNAGVAGTSLKNSLSILVETGLSVEPDVVVLGFYLNDFLDSYGVYIDQPPSILKKSWLAHYLYRAISVYRPEPEIDYTALHPDEDAIRKLDPLAIARMQRAYFDTLKVIKANMYYTEHDRLSAWQANFFDQLQDTELDTEQRKFYQQVLDNFRDWGGTWSPQAWAYMRPLFEEFKRLSDIHGFKLFIVNFPVRPQVEATALFDYPQKRLRETAEDLDIPYLDMLPIFISAHYQGEDLFLDHCHHTTTGNKIIAESIYQFLSNQQL